jgi:hypothetical protein
VPRRPRARARRHDELLLLEIALEPREQVGAQRRHVLGALRESRRASACAAATARARIGVDAVDLVHHDPARDLLRADLREHVARHRDLRLVRGIRRVDHVHEQVALARLVERGAEARHEVVRQVLDEADRVRDEHAQCAGGSSARTVVPSVANSLSCTSTSLPVSARIHDDLPAFV